MDHILAKHGYAVNEHDGPRPTTLPALIVEIDKNGNAIQAHLVWFVSDANTGSLEKQLKLKIKMTGV